MKQGTHERNIAHTVSTLVLDRVPKYFSKGSVFNELCCTS